MVVVDDLCSEGGGPEAPDAVVVVVVVDAVVVGIAVVDKVVGWCVAGAVAVSVGVAVVVEAAGDDAADVNADVTVDVITGSACMGVLLVTAVPTLVPGWGGTKVVASGSGWDG